MDTPLNVSTFVAENNTSLGNWLAAAADGDGRVGGCASQQQQQQRQQHRRRH